MQSVLSGGMPDVLMGEMKCSRVVHKSLDDNLPDCSLSTILSEFHSDLPKLFCYDSVEISPCFIELTCFGFSIQTFTFPKMFLMTLLIQDGSDEMTLILIFCRIYVDLQSD